MTNSDKNNEPQLADGEKGAILQADRKTYAVSTRLKEKRNSALVTL